MRHTFQNKKNMFWTSNTCDPGGGGGAGVFLPFSKYRKMRIVAPEPAQHCRDGADVPHGRQCRSGTARNCRTNILSRSQMKEHHLETLAACGNDCISMCAFWAIYRRAAHRLAVYTSHEQSCLSSSLFRARLSRTCNTQTVPTSTTPKEVARVSTQTLL